MKTIRFLLVAAAFVLDVLMNGTMAADSTIRVATYNTSLFRNADGQLVHDLEGGNNDQARKIAEVIQRVRPDVLFVNEFDYDESKRAAELFRTEYVAVGQNGCEPIKFEHFFTAPGQHGPAERPRLEP